MASFVSYNSDSARWDAYQFSDPYAATAFFCGNRKLDVICRPNCDHHPKVINKDDVVFYDNVHQAAASGFKACEHCCPMSEQPDIDLDLLKTTLDSINYSIGFTNETNEMKKRAFSTPSVNTSDGHLSDRQLTRNESDHIRLVELACRHIAAAAAESLSKNQDSTGQKKKRRGGVLGFKELASKSKLSPWHFHRVFKSVTGLTPKSYGDQCSKFMKNRERPQTHRQRSHFRSNSDITNNYQSKNNKRVKREESIAPTEPFMVPVGDSKSPSSGNPAPFVAVTPLTPFNDNYAMHSLDINAPPMRHHSLDLGVVGLDSLDLTNATVLQLSPEFVPVSQQMHSMPVEFNLGQEVNPSNTQVVDFNSNGSSSHHSTDGESLNIFQISEPQWPSIETSTPQQDQTRLLTPPSSVAADIDNVNVGKAGDEGCQSLLNTESPLESDFLFDMNSAFDNQSSYGLLSGDAVGASFLYGTEGSDTLFDGITSKSSKDTDAILDLRV